MSAPVTLGGAGLPARLLIPNTGANRALRASLALAAVLLSLHWLPALLGYPHGVDLEIPLRSAARWAADGEPYLASSFAPHAAEADLPFLYPPYLLPLLVPLLSLPRPLVLGAWVLLCAVVAVAGVRRLGVRWPLVPLVLAWPPFAEGIICGNVAIFIGTAFIWLVTDDAPPGRAGGVRHSLAAALTVIFKVTQLHLLVALSRRRPGAAAGAAVLLVVIALATLPAVGIEGWSAWVAQLGRAADPAWTAKGGSIASLLPGPLSSVFIGATLAACLLPRAWPAWIGVLAVAGVPSIHVYGLIFLLPAMTRIRLEPALLAAILCATYSEPAWWMAVGIVAIGLLMRRSSPAA